MNRKISSLKDDMWDALKSFERKIAEFDATFACIPDGAFIINTEGIIIAINDTALNILGIQRSEVSQLPFRSWIETFKIHGPDGKPLSQKILHLDNKIISFDKTSGYALRIVNKKGRNKILSLSASPIYDEHQKSAMGTVVIFSDVTLQETLNSILQVTVKAETMRDLLNETADILSNNFNISMLGIYLYDEDIGTLRVRASKGLKKDVLKAVGLQYVSDGSPGLAAATVREKKIIIIEDVAAREITMGHGEIDECLGIKSAVGIPLLVGNTVQGSITLLQVAGKELSNEEIHILDTVSGQLAMSISKIRGAEDERISREVLSRRTAELNAIISQMVDGVLVVDAQGKMIMQNQSLRDMLGYSYGDYAKLYKVHKEKWLKALEPQYLNDDPVLPADYPMAQAITGKTVSGMIFRVKTKHGTPRILSISSTPLLGGDLSVQGSIAVLRDVTLSVTLSDISEIIIKSLNLNDMLKDSLDAIMDNMNLVTAGIYRYDPEAKVINMAVYRGYSQDAISVFGREKVSEKSRGIAGQSAYWRRPVFIDNIFEDQKTKKYSLDVAHKLGIYTVLALPIATGEELHGVMIITASQLDIISDETKNSLKIICNQLASGIKKVQADENERGARIEAEEARDTAEIYLDVMSHDIINANQVSLGYLELLESSSNIGENDLVMIDNSLKALRQSTRIIENVKKIMRIGGLITLDRIDVDAVVRDCIDCLPSGFKKISIDYTSNPGMFAMADGSIRDIFVNLLDNSLKFSGDEVHITIHADKIEHEGKSFYCVTVEDDGIGVRDEIKLSIFERFRSTGYKEKGRGLGLYLARSIIELYGGRIWVEDRVKGDYQCGAKFYVLIPPAD